MNVGIVGLGLIGGSIGRAAVKRTEHTVYATDLDENALQKGELLNAFHERLTPDNVNKIDLLLLCVYPDGVESVLDTYVPLLRAGAVVMDCVGVKRSVVDAMERYEKKYPSIAFLGGHPMAGREFSGVEHAVSNLYEKSTCLIVPVHTPIDALVKVKEFFISLGADGLVVTTAEEHDRIIAYTSQLAHVVSAAYVTSPTAREHHGFSAGSFRDMTRVARLNPDMWTELMLSNSDYLKKEVSGLIDRLEQFRTALDNNDENALKTLLSEGNEAKLEVEKNRLQKRNDAITK